MNCNEARPLLDLLYDELLDTKDSVLVVDHIKQCEECGVEWEALDALKQRIKSAREQTFIPPELMEKVSLSIKKDAQSNEVWGLFRQRLPFVAIAASVLLLGLVIGPQLLHSSDPKQEMLATRTSSAERLIADLALMNTTIPEPDKSALDRKLGYKIKYLHLPTWKMQNSGIYTSAANIARFDFVRDTNEQEKLSCYQALEGTISANGSAEDINGKQVTFGNKMGYEFAKFSQNGRDYLFVTKAPKSVLEDIVRGA